MWACALDELLEREATNGSGEYWAIRNSDSDGVVLPGLRWARNAGIHRLLALHRYSVGLTPPLTPPLRVGEIRWLARVELPPIRPSKQLEAAYDQHLEDHDARDTIASACRWFHRV